MVSSLLLGDNIGALLKLADFFHVERVLFECDRCLDELLPEMPIVDRLLLADRYGLKKAKV
jgi:hypothetical protein